MIGIYKITNKNTGRTYIGQSIHCGKRLDEHCKGSQLIDEIIQVEGIENFTFEVIKQVEKNDLSFWEDYYIMKYDTLFPNGYNRRWNCGEETRKQIAILVGETKTLEQSYTPVIPNKKDIEDENNDFHNKYLQQFDLEEKQKDFTPIVYVELKSTKAKLFYIYCYLYFHSVQKNNLHIYPDTTLNSARIAEAVRMESSSVKKYLNILESLNLIIKVDFGYVIREVTEIVDFISSAEYNELTPIELYILAKARRGNSYYHYNFYLKELYWGKTNNKSKTNQNEIIRNTLISLQEKGKLKVIFSSSYGKNQYTQITCF